MMRTMCAKHVES